MARQPVLLSYPDSQVVEPDKCVFDCVLFSVMDTAHFSVFSRESSVFVGTVFVLKGPQWWDR